jgi:hypothetical protein
LHNTLTYVITRELFTTFTSAKVLFKALNFYLFLLASTFLYSYLLAFCAWWRMAIILANMLAIWKLFKASLMTFRNFGTTLVWWILYCFPAITHKRLLST